MMGTNGAFAVPALNELAQSDPHSQVREAARHALEALQQKR
jgi:hypothetical protein